MNIPPLQSTGRFMPNNQYKLFNYWAIINGGFFSLVYAIYFWGGISVRDKYISAISTKILSSPTWKKWLSWGSLVRNISILLFPVFLALLFFGVLIWFSCYKRYPMMPSLLVYGSIVPILALYIWRCFITLNNASKKINNNPDTKTYFFALFYITYPPN